MSEQLHTALKKILEMPFTVNENAGSGKRKHSHEIAIANNLTNNGFGEVLQDITRINRNGKRVKAKKFKLLGPKSLNKALASKDRQSAIQALVHGMKPGEFICQPCGSQSFPDFLVCDFSGSFVPIEAKSGVDGCTPAWNDTLPKRNTIYILASGAHNETTLFLGQDVLEDAREKVISKHWAQVQALVKEAKDKLDKMDDEFSRGFALRYIRPKFEQGGGKKCGVHVDYFTHTDRKWCENNVLDFARNK